MLSYGRRDLILDNKSLKSSDYTKNLNDNLNNIINDRSIQEKEMKMPKSAVIETVRPEFSSDDWKFADKENSIGEC